MRIAGNDPTFSLAPSADDLDSRSDRRFASRIELYSDPVVICFDVVSMDAQRLLSNSSPGAGLPLVGYDQKIQFPIGVQVGSDDGSTVFFV